MARANLLNGRGSTKQKVSRPSPPEAFFFLRFYFCASIFADLEIKFPSLKKMNFSAALYFVMLLILDWLRYAVSTKYVTLSISTLLSFSVFVCSLCLILQRKLDLVLGVSANPLFPKTYIELSWIPLTHIGV